MLDVNELALTQNEVVKNLSHIVHEFKTPLLSLISLSNDIKHIVEKEDVSTGVLAGNNTKLKEKVELMEDLSNYSMYLINDIIHFAKMQGSNGFGHNLNVQSIKLSTVLNFCFKILKALLANKRDQIKPILELDPQVEEIYVRTDEYRIKQIILNLISNAVKFTNFGSIKITAKIEKEIVENGEKQYPMEVREALKIRVSDSGVGIRASDKDNIFKECYMIKNKERSMNTYGTGLGLRIAKKIASLLQLDLNCESKYGIGSTFAISINSDKYFRLGAIINNSISYKEPEYSESNLPPCNIIENGKNNIRRYAKSSTPLIQNTSDISDYEGVIVIEDEKSINESISDNLLEENNKIRMSTVAIDNSSDPNSFRISLGSGLNSTDSFYSKTTIRKEFEIDNNLMEIIKKLKYKDKIKQHRGEEERKTKSFSDMCVSRHVRKSKFNNGRSKACSFENIESLISSDKGIYKPQRLYNNTPPIFDNSTKSILIIDDHLLILRSFELLLNRVLNKYNVHNVRVIRGYDGVDLLRYITEDQKCGNTILCTFIDENMDFLNGSEAIKIIRNLQHLRKIKPPFICKVSADFDHIVEGSKSETEDCAIPKPANESEIETILRKCGMIHGKL